MVKKVYNLYITSKYKKRKGKETRVIGLSGGIHQGDVVNVRVWSPRAKKTITKRIKL